MKVPQMPALRCRRDRSSENASRTWGVSHSSTIRCAPPVSSDASRRRSRWSAIDRRSPCLWADPPARLCDPVKRHRAPVRRVTVLLQNLHLDCLTRSKVAHRDSSVVGAQVSGHSRCHVTPRLEKRLRRHSFCDPHSSSQGPKDQGIRGRIGVRLLEDSFAEGVICSLGTS